MSIGVPSLVTQRPAGAPSGLELIVSGEDASSKSFRESVTVLSLQGRDCTYESRQRIQPGSSLMVEISPTRDGEPVWRTAAIAEAIFPAGPGRDIFRVSVVLGRAYEGPISTGAEPSPGAVQPVGAVAVNPPQTSSKSEVAARPPAGGAKGSELERLAGALRPMIAQMVREAVTLESERQICELRGSITLELERAVQAPVAELTQYAKTLPAANEEIIRRTVERAA